ncbi:LolA family protein [Acidicapsa acidisoli]|uniref:LolA family protein n=1 Tax=Acidicapsa acidisoli TaxID=1615681 RepID=UPI0021E0D881|nr:hypothetical protein [Acidicapsa acidisoli]
MLRIKLIVGMTLACAVAAAMAADTTTPRSSLTAAEIVNKNVAARGGLQAWRSVQSMTFQGKLGAGGNQRTTLPASLPDKKAAALPTDPRPKEEVLLPFVMEMQRPHKVRFELQFRGQAALQVYDGENGWKLRPYLNRREVEPFTADEAKAASMQAELDGPLIDYVAKGTRVDVEGMEEVEDRDTYRLKLTMKNGQSIHLWIDSKTFLETKIEGQPRRLDGIDHPVEIYYRDYRPTSGLEIPYLLETKVLPLPNPASRVKENPIPAERILIERVLVNPKFEASLFSKPQAEVASLNK